MLEKAFKTNYFFDYTMLTDFYDGHLKDLGGFRKSILDKWSEYLSYAASDFLTSELTKEHVLFKNRVSFIKTIMMLKASNVYELAKAKRENNLEYFYQIIPKEYLMKISLLSMLLENAQNDTRAMLLKYQLESQIYRYISYLYYENVMQKLDKSKQEEIVTRLLKLSKTFYNPDIKLDCGLI